MKKRSVLMGILFLPAAALAGEGQASAVVDMTGTIYGYFGVIVFIAAYSLVPMENVIHLRKSKPVLIAAGVIWALIAAAYAKIGDFHTAHDAIGINGVKSTVDPCSKLLRVNSRLDPIFPTVILWALTNNLKKSSNCDENKN